MNTNSRIRIAMFILAVLAACRASKEQPCEPVQTTTVAAAPQTPATKAAPTVERTLEWKLHEHADPQSVRVVIGDRLGIEGQDYVIDREASLLRLLGSDPQSPARYYVQYSFYPDPAHPEFTQGVAFGNHGDQETVQRLLASAPN